MGTIGCGDSTDPAIGPQAIDAAILAAEQYFSANDVAKAEAVLVRLIEVAPQTYRAHELYAQVLYRRAAEAQARGDEAASRDLVGRAYEQYREALEHCPEDDPALAAGLQQSAGEFASVAGRRADALGHFQAAGQLDPANPKPPLYEAQMLLLLERYAEAEVALRRSLMLDPNEPFAHASLASVAQATGDCERALAHMDEARRIDPAGLALRVQESRIRRRCGDPRGALQILVALSAQTRAQESLAAEIAAGWRALGEPAQAAAAWEHRLGVHPGAWPAALEAARAHLAAGDPERAWVLWQEAKAAAPRAPEVTALGDEIAAGGRTP